MHRERRSQEGGKVIIEVAEQAAIDASVVVGGSFRAIGVHRAAVVIAKIAIVNCGVVCINSAMQGQLLLIGPVLQALSLHMPCWFVRKGVDGARYLALAPRLLIACFFLLIVTMAIFPVTSGAFDARTFF